MKFRGLFPRVFLVFITIIICGITLSERNHYSVLGVRKSASGDEIKKAYRALAKKLHPDKNKHDPKAQDKFIELSKAYEVLGDDSARRLYDSENEYTAKYGSGYNSAPGGGYHRQAQQFQRRSHPNAHQFHTNPFENEGFYEGNQENFVYRTKNGFYYTYRSSKGICNPVTLLCMCVDTM